MPDLISVIVPTYDRPDALDACLAGLARSRYPGEGFEVVVVDDGSAAPLDDLVARHRDTLPVVLERQANSGPAAARNRGAARARGSLLAFTDDDCVVDPDWLAALARAARRHPEHLIGGRVVNLLDGNRFAAASQDLVSYLYQYGSADVGAPRWFGFFASNNLAVPAGAFRALGGFDESFPLAAGEDRDFCARWRERGWPALHVPEALVQHRHPLNARRFWRQHFNYGRGAYHFHLARTGRGGGPLRPEPATFYVDMLRYPFEHETLGRAIVQASLLGVAQCANTLGYFRERRRQARAAGRLPA
jgi:GT2 family glycosyltransferase